MFSYFLIAINNNSFLNILRKYQNGFLLKYYELFDGGELITYSQEGMQCLVLKPTRANGKTVEDPYPSIVFYFGGGFYKGSIQQFIPFAQYFKDQGFIVFIPDYRVKLRHGTTIHESIEDVFTFSFFLKNCGYNIDRGNITYVGASAGGVLAMATSLYEQSRFSLKDEAVLRPSKVVLFSPVVEISPLGYNIPELGDSYPDYSPLNFIDQDSLPPILIFHGTSDQAVNYNSVNLFCDSLNSYGHWCKLHMFEDVGHHFFEYGQFENKYFECTKSLMQEFIIDDGCNKVNSLKSTS